MILRVLAIGSVRGPLAAAVEDYETRAKRYWRLEIVELKAGPGKKDRPETTLQAEENRILQRLEGSAHVVALTREGEPARSRDLAEFLQERALRSIPEVVFVLGGAYGLGNGVLAKASSTLSLSRMTFPHELARLVLAEQLYRAGTILRNEPYHKGP